MCLEGASIELGADPNLTTMLGNRAVPSVLATMVLNVLEVRGVSMLGIGLPSLCVGYGRRKKILGDIWGKF